MTKKKPANAAARSGVIFAQDLSSNSASTIDETLEALDRFRTSLAPNPSDEELSYFPEALAAAGLENLKQAGLPTDFSDLVNLEWDFEAYCRCQPRKPKYSESENPEAVRQWEEKHAAYWDGLKDSPAVTLFSSEKLIAAYRMQGVAVNVIDALIHNQTTSAFTEGMKLAMLAIRSGIPEESIAEALRVRKTQNLKRYSRKAGIESGKVRIAKNEQRDEAILSCYNSLSPSKKRRGAAGYIERYFGLRPDEWEKEWGNVPTSRQIRNIIKAGLTKSETSGNP